MAKEIIISDSDLWFCNNLKCIIDMELKLVSIGEQEKVDRKNISEWIDKYTKKS